MSDHVELQSLVDSHEQPFVVIGNYYRVMAVNRAYQALFNQGGQAVVGLPCYKVLHHRERPCNELGEECPYLDCLVTKQAGKALHRHLGPDGEARWVRIQMYPIRSASGATYVGETLQEIAAKDGTALIHDAEPVGRSQAFLRTVEQLEQAARTDAPVLLMGETGTGKELAARFVHQSSRRSRQPCVTVDCSVITDSLFESEMFGHERGAFTGSVDSKQGLFEIANEGTIFFDEIGEASPGMQAKLLRVLETGEFRRVGGNRVIRANPRLICATNRPLWRNVEAREFREDLYYRIACFCIRIPSLRERMEDIPLLADALLRRIGLKDHRSYRLSDGALELLLGYHYPGNIRELRNILQVAAVHAASTGDGLIEGEAIAEAMRMRERSDGSPEVRRAQPGEAREHAGPRRARSRPLRVPDRPHRPLYAPHIERIEAQHIAQLLHLHRGNRRQVAVALGISERTLYRKLAQYDLK